MSEKVREFWIERGSFKWNCEENKELLHGWKVGGVGPFHVIEKAPVMEQIENLKAENERFKEALRRIAAEVFRGPRPWSASFAYKVLHGDEE